MAYGSLCELETQTSIAEGLGYLKPETARTLLADIGEVERMLKALMKSLERKRGGKVSVAGEAAGQPASGSRT